MGCATYPTGTSGIVMFGGGSASVGVAAVVAVATEGAPAVATGTVPVGVGMGLGGDPMGSVAALVVRVTSPVTVGAVATDGVTTVVPVGTAVVDGVSVVVVGTTGAEPGLAFVFVLLFFLIVGCFKWHLISGFGLDKESDGKRFTGRPMGRIADWTRRDRHRAHREARGALEDRGRVRRESDPT